MARRCNTSPHLLAQRTVVVDVQHVDVHGHRRLKLPVGGGDSERVAVSGLAVQTLLHDQTPLALVLLDDGELAQRVPVCRSEGDSAFYIYTYTYIFPYFSANFLSNFRVLSLRFDIFDFPREKRGNCAAGE